MNMKKCSVIAVSAILVLGLVSCKKENKQTENQEEAVVEVVEPESEQIAAEGEQVFATDFTLNDINGNPLTLSSLRGKVVILDFWGSWCRWCIKGIPDMKAYYQKYDGKFEILGIDCGDTEEDWREAVRHNELPWLHVYNPEDSDVTEKYNIEGYPTKIIVAADGTINKIFIGEDPAFYEYLDELLK